MTDGTALVASILCYGLLASLHAGAAIAVGAIVIGALLANNP